jgi:hypothetical protein
MLKFTKVSWLIIITGVLAVAFVVLYLTYQQRAQESDALNQTVAQARKVLPSVAAEKKALEPQVASLEQKLATLRSQFEGAKASFSQASVQSIEYDNELSDLAEKSNVFVTRLAATDDATVNEGNTTFITNTYDVDVTGNVTDLLDYVHRVALSSYFKNAVLNTLDMVQEAPTLTPATPTPTPTESPTPTAAPTLHLSLTVYRYEGN